MTAIDREWLARSINNVLQGAGLDPVDMAVVAQIQLADARARQQAGERIETALGLSVPEAGERLVPRHTQPAGDMNGEDANAARVL